MILDLPDIVFLVDLIGFIVHLRPFLILFNQIGELVFAHLLLIEKFLGSLFQRRSDDVYINSRQLPSGKNDFIRPGELEESAPRILSEAIRNHQNLYFGVAPRVDGDGTKQGITEIITLHVDIDFKDTPLDRVQQLLKEFPLKPSFQIGSGGGLHLYFLLREAVSKEDILKVENLLRRLALFFWRRHELH